MATRITHTNNSSGHDGTFVYRSTSPMDPQALPAPIADEPPVSLGAVFEYIDNVSESGAYYYRTQDYEGGQVSAVSGELSIEVPLDYDKAQAGDYIGGGVYAGIITYADTREFHLVFARQDGEASGLRWGNMFSVTGVDDPDDGFANQQEILTNHDNNAEAFYHCRDYIDGSGNNDYYLPASNELAKAEPLVSESHPEFSENTTAYRDVSQEFDSDSCRILRISDGDLSFGTKNTDRIVRPVRRIPV